MEPVIFKPLPSEDIEVMIFKDLQAKAKQKKLLQAKRDDLNGWGSIFIGLLLGAAAPQLSSMWGILGLALILTGIYFFITAGVNLFQSRKVKVNSKILKGKFHNARNAAKGNCPICESEIIVYDAVTDHHFQCAVCTANLQVQNYEVTAR